MLAALPFENLAGNMRQERIADGLSHAIISQLGPWKASKVDVISHTSSKLYRGMQKPITEIRRELKVDFIVEGSIRRLDDGYRITVLLIRVKDQAHLRADIYNWASGSITAPQTEVAGTISREIGNRIAADPGTNSRRAATPYTAPSFQALILPALITLRGNWPAKTNLAIAECTVPPCTKCSTGLRVFRLHSET